MDDGNYRTGYQCAAGGLLSREKTPTDIGLEVNRRDDPFYEGMRQALRDYLALLAGFDELASRPGG